MEFKEDLEKKLVEATDILTKNLTSHEHIPNQYHLQIYGTKEQLIEVMEFFEKLTKEK